MIKNATYKEKFQILQPVLPALIDEVKKDLRSEHLKADWPFAKKYFAGKSAAKLTVEEMVPAYYEEIAENGNEALAEFIGNRWLLKHTEIYDYFAAELAKISDDFESLEEIEAGQARQLVKGATALFEAIHVYFFTVLNSVVLPKEVFKELEQQAQKGLEKAAKEQKAAAEKVAVERNQRDMELEMDRTVNRYEKKLSGLQKKYLDDTAALKKQISTLQKKLAAQATEAGLAS